MSIDSGAASMKRSASAPAAMSVLVVMRARAASRAAASMRPLSTSRPRPFSMPAMPLAMNSSATSIMTTSRPATADTWAMPAPIWPAPATRILLTLTVVLLVQSAREPVR